jgi:proline iminopeptidase
MRWSLNPDYARPARRDGTPVRRGASPRYDAGMKNLFPPIRPHHTGRLKVSRLHPIHSEVCGNPRGKPIVFLHGGPGGGIDPLHRRFFDRRKWRIVLFDQRGCGKSTPHAELRENTTWDLVADIEKLRDRLGIERWVVFGGSWGSTLALAYSQAHPERVRGIVLRGIFLLRKRELAWFYQEGASRIFPDAWESYLAPIPPRERGDLIRAYHRRLTSRSRAVRLAAARAWSVWEASTSKLQVDPGLVRRFDRGRFAESFARIESHYFVNGVVCPMDSAWALHRAWPEAKLIVVPDAGHSMTEPGIRDALIRETDAMARL